MRHRSRGNLPPVESIKWHPIWRLKLAAEMTRKVFQRASVTRFVPLNHARANQRDHLYREFQAGALAGRLKIEGIQRNCQTPAIRVHGFT
jgi:hypothetical protein